MSNQLTWNKLGGLSVATVDTGRSYTVILDDGLYSLLWMEQERDRVYVSEAKFASESEAMEAAEIIQITHETMEEVSK